MSSHHAARVARSSGSSGNGSGSGSGTHEVNVASLRSQRGSTWKTRLTDRDHLHPPSSLTNSQRKSSFLVWKTETPAPENPNLQPPESAWTLQSSVAKTSFFFENLSQNLGQTWPNPAPCKKTDSNLFGSGLHPGTVLQPPPCSWVFTSGPPNRPVRSQVHPRGALDPLASQRSSDRNPPPATEPCRARSTTSSTRKPNRSPKWLGG